jgi:hypothetical protein
VLGVAHDQTRFPSLSASTNSKPESVGSIVMNEIVAVVVLAG